MDQIDKLKAIAKYANKVYAEFDILVNLSLLSDGLCIRLIKDGARLYHIINWEEFKHSTDQHVQGIIAFRVKQLQKDLATRGGQNNGN